MKEKKIIKYLLLFFSVSLFISGITAFPIAKELEFVHGLTGGAGVLHEWIDKVYKAYSVMNARFPFIAYGTDWLAFAHILLAVLFLGVIKDPVRNK